MGEAVVPKMRLQITDPYPSLSTELENHRDCPKQGL